MIEIEAKVQTGITIGIVIRTVIDQIVMTDDNTDRIEVGLDTNRIIGEEISEETLGALADRVAEERIGTITEMTGMIEAGTGLERGCFPETITIEIGVQAKVGPGQDPEHVQR